MAVVRVLRIAFSGRIVSADISMRAVVAIRSPLRGGFRKCTDRCDSDGGDCGKVLVSCSSSSPHLRRRNARFSRGLLTGTRIAAAD